MNKAVNRRLGFWMALFFAALLGCIPLTGYIERHQQEYRWIGATLGIGLLLFLLGNLALMLWYGLRMQRRFGHQCPSCGKSLAGFVAQIAIASGHCAHCGEKVFTAASPCSGVS